jgi:mRNA interferase MazF
MGRVATRPALVPVRGEIWLAHLDPTVGREQAGTRFVLVVSNDYFNAGPADLVAIVPLTRTDRGLALHVPIAGPEANLTGRGVILCDQPRTIAKARLIRRKGTVEPPTLRAVESRLRAFFSL